MAAPSPRTLLLLVALLAAVGLGAVLWGGPVAVDAPPVAAPPPAALDAGRPAAPADAPAADAVWEPPPPPSDFDRAFESHAAEAGPRWARVGAVLDQSDQPPLANVSRDLAAQLAAPPADAAGRRDLLMAQRQLLAVLQDRYGGAQVMDEELAAMKRSLAAVDAAGGVLPAGAAPPR